MSKRNVGRLKPREDRRATIAANVDTARSMAAAWVRLFAPFILELAIELAARGRLTGEDVRGLLARQPHWELSREMIESMLWREGKDLQENESAERFPSLADFLRTVGATY